MSEPGTADSTYTAEDGATWGPDGGLISFPTGTPTMTSFDGDHDGYYETSASADEDRDGYDEFALSDHDGNGAVDEVVLDTDADGWGDAAITDGAPYGAAGTVAVADTDNDGYADLVVPGL